MTLTEQILKEYNMKFESCSGGINPWKFKHCTPDWKDLESINEQFKSFLLSALTRTNEECVKELKARVTELGRKNIDSGLNYTAAIIDVNAALSDAASKIREMK